MPQYKKFIFSHSDLLHSVLQTLGSSTSLELKRVPFNG